MNKSEKSKNLDLPLEELQRHLYDAADMVVRLYSDIEHARVFQNNSPAEVRALFDEPLPQSSTDIESLLARIEQDVFTHSTKSIGPNFYGYVNSGGNHASLIAEVLSVALDQNTGKWNLGPAATEMELRVIRWIAEFMGYPSDTGGVLVSGGSAANLTCLKTARDFKAPFDIRNQGTSGGGQLTLYVSTEGHSCLDKSVDMLGIGKEQLRKIPVNNDFTIDTQLLEEKILEDRFAGFVPICIIANGGTVNTGAVDPMNTLADIAARHKLWLHVDAAYGGPAAGTSHARELFAGLDRADSVATDAHKWLYVQYDIGVALVKNKPSLHTAFSLLPAYLRYTEQFSDRHDATEHHFELSRNFKALKLWMTFKAYGSDELRSAIENNIQTMHHLADLIDSSPDFQRLAPAPLSVVCFRYRPEDEHFRNDDQYLSLLNKKILAESEKDGRVFLTGTIIQEKQVLRACSVNHRTQKHHVEFLLQVLREIGARCHLALQRQKEGAAV